MSETRNPKHIKQMITDSRGEMGDETIEELAKLRGLNADDKTENAMLRSRIDEQCELIMILKQRADEVSSQLKTSERIRHELEEFRKHAEGSISLEVTKYNMLDSRFNDLANNHQELIKFKDQYKHDNARLRKENMKLKEDNENLFSSALQQRDQTIDDLELELKQYKEKNAQLELNASEAYKAMIENRAILQERLQKTEENLNSKVKALEKKLMETEIRLNEANSKYEQEHSKNADRDVESTNRLVSLTREKDELLKLVMERGKVIEDKGSENRVLEARLEESKKRLKMAEERFEKEAAAVDANIRVVKLKKELAETQDHVTNIDKMFEAYKLHTSKLLQQERDLNAKLRHLVG